MLMIQSNNAPLQQSRWLWLFGAWIASVTASLGALFIGEVIGQAPCSLCWHQRAFMFPLAVILAIASFRSDSNVLPYAISLALLGSLIAGFHSLLYAGFIPEGIQPCAQGPSCSSGDMVFGGAPLPYLSLAAFISITAALFAAQTKGAS